MPDIRTEIIDSVIFRNKFQSMLRDLNLIVKKEKYEYSEIGNELKEKRIGWSYIINNQIDNPYLIFNRLFIPGDESNNKKEFLHNFLLRYQALQNNTYYSCVYNRHIKIMASYQDIGYKTEKDLVLQTDWRLIAGLGGANVLETSISLHPLYGFPYLPGSTVKGIARSYALMIKNLACEQDDIDKLNPDSSIDDEAISIFGTQENAGEVIFFDAIPYKQLPDLKLDIMNNHYSDYYEKGIPPGDWMDPNPIFFITVAPEQKFSFFLASRKGKLLDKAKEWLQGGLMNLGAGGKTSAGYGYFLPDNFHYPEINSNVISSTSQQKQSKSFIKAEIVDADSRPVKVKISETNEIIMVGNFNPKGLSLSKGSLILIEPIYDRKSKKIQSAIYKAKFND